jgi:two-component system chemotaxis sensor kinase CheA
LFSDERGSELKELFFESALELLQSLNQGGLRLERHPEDPEVIRGVRRAVHTLKGDSATCGYRELSSLAHELEDALTPELAQSSPTPLAELVLKAADTFEDMLAAYRKGQAPPSGQELRAAIRELAGSAAGTPLKKANGASSPAASLSFVWTEYERLVITQAASTGKKILQVAAHVDPACAMRSAAVQLVRNVLQEAGTILAMHPEDSSAAEVTRIEIALATRHAQNDIARKCRIPGVVSDVFILPWGDEKSAAKRSGRSKAIKQQSKSKGKASGKTVRTKDARRENEATSRPALTTPPPAGQNVEGQSIALEASSTPSASGVPESILRVDAERIDAVLNLVGELIIGKSMLTQSISQFDKKFPKDPLRSHFSDALAFQSRVLNDLQKSVMKIRMVPVEQLFRRFPRVVRDVARERGREVILEISGEDTDLDKSVLDSLAEPLTHILRNAVDHGIESPAERAAEGKPAQGKLHLKAYHQANQVVIEISDDGRGIPREKLLQKAIASKIISAEDARRLSPDETLNLIFHPGLSTADQVTAISGRGVGMDVVKTAVDRLKGSVHIESEPGQGTTFHLKVPLTLAIIKALLFRAGERLYAVPLAAVVEITRALESEFHQVENHEVIQLRDQVLTLMRLEKLERNAAAAQPKKVFIIVISRGERRFGLVVDKLVGEDELVIKALDDHLVATDLVSGASILGDGTVVLILDIAAVVARLGRAARPAPALRKGATA